jgi:ACR3 family arsenite efflux pump ArsB
VYKRQVLVAAAAAILAVIVGIGFPTSEQGLGVLITPVLAFLLYVTFLDIPFPRFRDAFTNTQFMAAALVMNFIVVPGIVYGLTRFLTADPVVLIGVLMVLLTPCIDYVIPFTDLAGGNAEQVTVVTPVLLLAQLLLLPVFLWLFIGGQIAGIIDTRPFVEAFVFIIVFPLTLAWLTEIWAYRSSRGEFWHGKMGSLPVPMMGVTLFVVIASQLPRIQDSITEIISVIPVYVAFLVILPILGQVAARSLQMDVGESRALVFTSVTRNSLVVLPLTFALPPGYEIVPAVVITQTLVELTGMVVLIRAVPAYLIPTDQSTIKIPGLTEYD